MPQILRPLLAAAVALAAGGAAQAATTVVYSNNFDAPFVLAPGVTRTVELGGLTIGPSIAPFNATHGNFARNNTTNLSGSTLSNLPAHTAATLSFDVIFLDSWDSTNGTPAPDLFEIFIDDALVLTLTSNQASGTVSQFGGGTLLHDRVQFDGNQFYSDVVVDMSTAPALTFAHSASSLSIRFRASGNGWQGGIDEAWGVDNLVVSVAANPVPEPSTYALMALGLAGLRAVARRRKAS